MNIEKFLTLGAELESEISGVYLKIAQLASEPAMAKTLLRISDEEIHHAAVLKTGMNYLKEAPDAFLKANVTEDALDRGLRECRDLLASLRPDSGLLPCLKKILKFEKEFERVHLGASIALADAQLKQLFVAMAKGDQNHIATLEKIISGA